MNIGPTIQEQNYKTLTKTWAINMNMKKMPQEDVNTPGIGLPGAC